MKMKGGLELLNRLMIYSAEDGAGGAVYHGSRRPTITLKVAFFFKPILSRSGGFGCASEVLKGTLAYCMH